jgi:hypothetical protein
MRIESWLFAVSLMILVIVFSLAIVGLVKYFFE